MKRNKRGQVWIETVTYTLVALVLIGLVLTYAQPKVEELQNQVLVEQSIEMLKQIDSVILELQETGEGNKRKVELSLNKGTFVVNSSNDSLTYSLEGNYLYSQPGEEFYEGSFKVLTTDKGNAYLVTIKKEYSSVNLTYMGKEESKTFSKASTPYVIYVSNKGGNQIDLEI